MLKTYGRKRRQESKIIEDVHALCRLCLDKAEQPVPIFEEGNSVCAALPMRIMICVGHEITQEDCLPNSICTHCHQELEKYYKFRKKCENSYLTLKGHFNATKYQDRISELRSASKLYTEDNETNISELFEYKIQEDIELQPDEMERLVIVDVYNIEESAEYEKPLLPINSVAETDMKIQPKMEETTEIQVIQQADDISPDISTFLNAILVELGILVKNDQGLVVQDQGVTSFELDTGDDQHVEFELVEEDDEIAVPVEVPMTPEVQSDTLDTDSKAKDKNKNVRVRKNKADSKTSGAWCGTCGRTFSSGGAARRHAAALHAQLRPHACRHCGRRFAQKAVCDRHRLVHQAVRPHACARCSASFTQRGALSAHARTHCGPGAPPARALALHACTHCDRVFLYPSGLSRHMLTHTGPGFACHVCQRRFNDKSSLLRHAKNAHPNSIQPIDAPGTMQEASV